MRDDYLLSRMEREGYPKKPEWPICPCCGQECETVFKDSDGDIIGCDNCLRELDAWLEESCFKGGDA